jgi:hypothetical protein
VKTLVEGIGGLNTAPVEVVEISEERIDFVMNLLHEADPVRVNYPSSYTVCQGLWPIPTHTPYQTRTRICMSAFTPKLLFSIIIPSFFS